LTYPLGPLLHLRKHSIANISANAAIAAHIPIAIFPPVSRPFESGAVAAEWLVVLKRLKVDVGRIPICVIELASVVITVRVETVRIDVPVISM
jgi:hypothetical protein